MKRVTIWTLAPLLLVAAGWPGTYAKSWEKELKAKVLEVYKESDRAFGNLEDLKNVGTLMVLTQDGVIGTLSSETKMWTTGVKDGKISTAGAAQKGTGRSFKKGDKVYLLDVDVLPDTEGSDIIRMWVISAETSQRTEEGSTVDRRYKGALDFQFPLKYLPTADFAEVKKAINTAIVAENEYQPTGSTTATVAMGMTPEEVEGAIGKPQKIIDLGAKKIYVYADMKITFMDGRVADVQ